MCDARVSANAKEGKEGKERKGREGRGGEGKVCVVACSPAARALVHSLRLFFRRISDWVRTVISLPQKASSAPFPAPIECPGRTVDSRSFGTRWRTRVREPAFTGIRTNMKERERKREKERERKKEREREGERGRERETCSTVAITSLQYIT